MGNESMVKGIACDEVVVNCVEGMKIWARGSLENEGLVKVFAGE